MRDRINQVRADVILDNLGHQPGHGPTRTGDQVHHLFASCLGIQGALDRLDLSAYAADSRKKLLPIADGVGHRRILA
jgi:hypothetical protein